MLYFLREGRNQRQTQDDQPYKRQPNRILYIAIGKDPDLEQRTRSEQNRMLLPGQFIRK